MQLSAIFKRLPLVFVLSFVDNAWASATGKSNNDLINNWSNATYSIESNRLTINGIPARSDFNLIGNAEFSYLFWDVYDSYLFSTKNTIDAKSDWFAQTPMLLEIRYKRDIKAKDLIDSTVEQWQHLKYQPSDYEQFVPWLSKTWPNLKEGDRLALLVYPDHSVFFYNQTFLAKQTAPQFGKIFLDIWLSEGTSEPKLRLKLLAQDKSR